MNTKAEAAARVETVSVRYASGQLGRRECWLEGKRHGLYEEWFPTGQISFRVNYKNGVRHGLREEWHRDGQMSFRVNYKNDVLHGLYESWFYTGQIEYRGNIIHGKKHGVHEKWPSAESGHSTFEYYANNKQISEAAYKAMLAALGALVTELADLRERGLGVLVAQHSDLLPSA